MPTFDLECFQNEYLSEGADEVNAIVTITASGGTGPSGGHSGAPAAPGPSGSGSEVVIIDTSGSMKGPKMRQAIDATIAAIGCIRDGVRFAVIAGTHEATMVYPSQPGLAASSPLSRQEAVNEVTRLQAGGGTAIGSWIALGARVLGPEPGVRHAILLTDGKDEHESSNQFAAALDSARGVFQCDCRGVGTDWVVNELRQVAIALLGSVDIVADPAGLTADFTAMMEASMGKTVADVALRVWIPQGAEVLFVKQVAPDLVDLTGSVVRVNDHAGDYPTGAWGDESRDYHVCVRVVPGGVGDEMLAARVTLMVDGQASGQSLVRGVWTDDAALSTRINRQVAHYTGQAELANAVQEGLDARKSGDVDTAVVKLGRAVQLAEQSGNKATAELLARVVEVDDVATGRVRLKNQVEQADEMTLDTRSTKTVRARR
jgi:hypothetical protein